LRCGGKALTLPLSREIDLAITLQMSRLYLSRPG
jgi:hypothetical protein